MIYLFAVLCLLGHLEAKKSKDEEKPAWAKKDIRDYTDADLERLLDQWDVSWYFYYLFRGLILSLLSFCFLLIPIIEFSCTTTVFQPISKSFMVFVGRWRAPAWRWAARASSIPPTCWFFQSMFVFVAVSNLKEKNQTIKNLSHASYRLIHPILKICWNCQKKERHWWRLSKFQANLPETKLKNWQNCGRVLCGIIIFKQRSKINKIVYGVFRCLSSSWIGSWLMIIEQFSCSEMVHKPGRLRISW